MGSGIVTYKGLQSMVLWSKGARLEVWLKEQFWINYLGWHEGGSIIGFIMSVDVILGARSAQLGISMVKDQTIVV